MHWPPSDGWRGPLRAQWLHRAIRHLPGHIAIGKPKRERLHSEIRHRISGGRAVSSASTGEWCSILPPPAPPAVTRCYLTATRSRLTSKRPITTTSHITLQITALSVTGIPVPVPPSCKSANPAKVRVKSQKGFSVVKGGRLRGTYTIPPFAHCGLLTPLLNGTVPGPGNIITLRLGKAKRVG